MYGHEPDVDLTEAELNAMAGPPAEQPAEDMRIAQAIADTVGCTVEDLKGWSVIVEHRDGDDITIRTLWATNVTPWGVRGYAHEMVRHTEKM